MPRSIPTLSAWLIAAAVAFGASVASAKVRVELTGVDGDPRDNVMATLSIANAPRKSDDTELRRMHASADEEIRRALEPWGYYKPIIHTALETEGRNLIARYSVQPGPRIPVKSVDVLVLGEGASDPLLVNARRGFPLAVEEPLDHMAYEQGKRRLAEAAAEGGFLDARFDTSAILIDREAYEAGIVIRYRTGPRYRFGEVRFEQDVVNPDLLQGYVNFDRGAPADVRKLIGLQEALGRSPYWKRVEVLPRRDLATNGELPIVVDLIPAQRIRFTAGGGYGTDGGAEARSRAEWRRVNRRGHRAAVEGAISQVERSGSLEYAVPWPYPRTDVLTMTTGLERIESDVRVSRTALAKAAHTRMWAGWRHLLGLTYRVEKFEVGADTGTTRFLTADGEWSRTRADDVLDPLHGVRLKLASRGAHESVLSDASFFQIDGDGKWVETLGRGNRVLIRGRAGTTFGDDARELPPSLRYFAGGSNSVRGYPWEGLGPRDESGQVTGGDHLLVASVEFERRMFRNYGAAIFWDTGNAFSSWSGAFDQLEHGAGVGVRWISPLGRVRGDVAWPIGGDKVRFHLSVGPDL